MDMDTAKEYLIYALTEDDSVEKQSASCMPKMTCTSSTNGYPELPTADHVYSAITHINGGQHSQTTRLPFFMGLDCSPVAFVESIGVPTAASLIDWPSGVYWTIQTLPPGIDIVTIRGGFYINDVGWNSLHLHLGGKHPVAFDQFLKGEHAQQALARHKRLHVTATLLEGTSEGAKFLPNKRLGR
ncbi:hypothetical protein BDV19DRAFT_389605 [Aspergillus venezuelensis]